MMGRDLVGLLVVSLEQAVAAPLATARLADAGARWTVSAGIGSAPGRAVDRASGPMAFTSALPAAMFTPAWA